MPCNGVAHFVRATKHDRVCTAFLFLICFCAMSVSLCDCSGKWHLGSFYNDSEIFGGRLSSPLSHGFDLMNATVEVSPTATTNCECNAEWQDNCNYGCVRS